jgi:hypothetical protein
MERSRLRDVEIPDCALFGAEGSIAMVMLWRKLTQTREVLRSGCWGISAGGFGLAALGSATIRIFPFGWRGLFAIAFSEASRG